ncbi:hypothetical protein FRB90_004039 [Tulasnella sp. 427]|nr:hypothetical protein FRB90_004039 [Tulasnella sp. 427]
MPTSNARPQRSPTPPPALIEDNKVAYSASREQIIDFLRHIHIYLPPKPGYTDAQLLRKLIDAIDCLQEIGKLLGSRPLSIVPRSELWSLSRRNVKKVWKKLWRVTKWDTEHYYNVARPVNTPFTLLRMLVTEVAIGWRDKQPFMRFRNPDCSTLLMIRASNNPRLFARRLIIRKVYEVDPDTALFSVYYRLFEPGEQFTENVDHEWPQTTEGFYGPFKGFGFAFEIFLTQLLTNANRVPEKWRNDAPPGYRTSFLLPPGRLSPIDYCHLSNNDGCPICGMSATVRCAECRMAWYCTEEHREDHWEAHEECCDTVRNAEWVRLVFDMHDFKGLTVIGIPHGIPAPANLRDKTPFKVTVRAPAGMHDEIDIWDVEEPARFMIISKLVHQHSSQIDSWQLVRNSAYSGERGCMTFWARRTGEWTIDIAANRPLELAERRMYVPTRTDRFIDWLWEVTTGGKVEPYD